MLGVAITRSLPYGPLSLSLDVAGCLLLIKALRSPIVPAISAGVLPLALGIQDWAYPASILVGTGSLALLSRWRSHRLAPPASSDWAPSAVGSAARDPAALGWGVGGVSGVAGDRLRHAGFTPPQPLDGSRRRDDGCRHGCRLDGLWPRRGLWSGALGCVSGCAGHVGHAQASLVAVVYAMETWFPRPSLQGSQP